MWTFPTSEYSNHLDIHTMSPGKLPKPAKHITVEQGLRQAKAVTADGNKLAGWTSPFFQWPTRNNDDKLEKECLFEEKDTVPQRIPSDSVVWACSKLK